jgi:Flp pilus assembly protein TadB
MMDGAWHWVAMALMAGFSTLLWVALLVLAVLGIVWLVRDLKSRRPSTET